MRRWNGLRGKINMKHIEYRVEFHYTDSRTWHRMQDKYATLARAVERAEAVETDPNFDVACRVIEIVTTEKIHTI